MQIVNDYPEVYPETINGTLKGKNPDDEFITIRVEDPGLVKVLDDLAQLLSRKESVQGEELRKMLGKPPEEPSTAPAES